MKLNYILFMVMVLIISQITLAGNDTILAEVGNVKITAKDFRLEMKNLPEYLKTMADTSSRT